MNFLYCLSLRHRESDRITLIETILTTDGLKSCSHHATVCNGEKLWLCYQLEIRLRNFQNRNKYVYKYKGCSENRLYKNNQSQQCMKNKKTNKVDAEFLVKQNNFLMTLLVLYVWLFAI